MSILHRSRPEGGGSVIVDTGEVGTDVHPVQVGIPEEELVELRRRIEATRWPSEELVADRSQGVQLATLQALARYWTTEYDLRRVEARLNALPQFTTEIDGIEIHFIHVRSRHEHAMPLIMTHGWPGSVASPQTSYRGLERRPSMSIFHRSRQADAGRVTYTDAGEAGSDVRPFQVEFAEEEIADLRRRIEATRWPSEELVGDRSQGVQLATLPQS